MALTLSGTNGIVGAGFTLDTSGASVTAGVGTFGSVASSGQVSGTIGAFSGTSTFANSINLTHASAGSNYIYFNEDLQLAKNGTGTRFTIDTSGNATVNSGNLVIGTAGKGIDFSNATDEASGESSTESILYDYEAGSFQPTLFSGTSGSSFSGNATNNGGYYVRIGRIVHISMNVRGTFTLGSGSGAIYIGNLPFTVGTTNELSGSGNSSYGFIGIPYHSGLTPATSYIIGGGMTVPATNYIAIYEKILSSASNPTAGSTRVATGTDAVNIHCSGSYLAT